MLLLNVQYSHPSQNQHRDVFASKKSLIKTTTKSLTQPSLEFGIKKNIAIDALIDFLPFELHPPGYKCLGPGTKLSERLEKGDVGVNPPDEACRQHENVQRCKADRVLAEHSFSRMFAGDTQSDERTLAMIMACCIVSKITFEKFFS